MIGSSYPILPLVVGERVGGLLPFRRANLGLEAKPGDLHLDRSTGEGVHSAVRPWPEARHYDRLAPPGAPAHDLQHRAVRPPAAPAAMGEQREAMTEEPGRPRS